MAFFITRYDFRVPGATANERQEVFSRALEQAAYVDAHGHHTLLLSEHHASDDGYLPSPMVAAGAFAAVTKKIGISVGAVLLNLHDPVRLAEDMIVLDHLSGGRVNYTLGLGYRPIEYALFDRSWKTRGADMDAALDLLLAALRGEKVDRGGQEVVVTPEPFTQPHPMLMVGGGSKAAARRAGRHGLGFNPQSGSAELKEAYLAACAEAGHQPGFMMSPPDNNPAVVFVHPDPEQFWERWGHHLFADANAYREWRNEGGRAPGTADHYGEESETVEEMRAAGKYLVLEADDLIERLRSKEISLITSHPACGGLPAEPSWESLRLLSETVMPAVRRR